MDPAEIVAPADNLADTGAISGGEPIENTDPNNEPTSASAIEEGQAASSPQESSPPAGVPI